MISVTADETADMADVSADDIEGAEGTRASDEEEAAARGSSTSAVAASARAPAPHHY